jgi:hypothetical protein
MSKRRIFIKDKKDKKDKKKMDLHITTRIETRNLSPTDELRPADKNISWA